MARRGEVVLGITYDPMRNEMFHAVRGKGVCLNRKKVAVSGVSELAQAAVGVDLGYQLDRSTEMLGIASKLWGGVHCLRLMGSSSLGMAYVASGRLSIYLHRHLYPWDIASGLLMTREGGGEVLNWEGKPAGIEDPAIIAANPGLLGVFRRWMKKL